MPRTLQSAEAFIKGMFPSLFNSSEDKGKLLTINTMVHLFLSEQILFTNCTPSVPRWNVSNALQDIDLDDMTPNWMLCPELAEWYSKMLTSKYYQQFNSTVLALKTVGRLAFNSHWYFSKILEPLVNQIQEKLKWNVSRDGSFSYHHFLDCLNTHVHRFHLHSIFLFALCLVLS